MQRIERYSDVTVSRLARDCQFSEYRLTACADSVACSPLKLEGGHGFSDSTGIMPVGRTARMAMFRISNERATERL